MPLFKIYYNSYLRNFDNKLDKFFSYIKIGIVKSRPTHKTRQKTIKAFNRIDLSI